MRCKIRTFVLLIAAAFLPGLSVAHADGAAPASHLLERGQADQALSLLNRVLAANPGDSAALNLACRVYFSEGLLPAAQERCERAVALAPDSSDNHLWLGRVLGRQAEKASPLAAFAQAKGFRAQFEAAYRLDARSAPAVADLAEYYVEAPHLLGGGEDKALALALAAASWDASLAHSIRAEVAIHRKQPALAESELRAAAASPGAKPEDWVALASFYRKQGRTGDILGALDTAIARDTAHDDALVSAAEQLTESGERPQQAIALLRSYLASANESENAPAFAVHAQLASLLNQAGDTRSAGRELAEAHALASQWQPRGFARAGA